MARRDQLEIVNPGKALRFAEHVQLGRAFAFLDAQASRETRACRKDDPVSQDAGGPKVVPLIGPAPLELPGMRLRAALLSGLWLASITSDKVVYRQGRDVVHLLGIHGRAAGREQAMVVRLGTTEFARRVVRLDAAGCAALSLTDLPQGEYEARWADDPAEEPGCDFTVAEFKLAPLVAMLVRRSLVGDPPQLAFTLRLEAFGVPVHGPIRLELTDRSARLAECRAEARHGEVQSTFVLTGEGPHAINVQMIGDPSRTATVPILGSRKAERSPKIGRASCRERV